MDKRIENELKEWAMKNYKHCEKEWVIKNYEDRCYFFPKIKEKSIKIRYETDDEQIKDNEDGTFTFSQKMYPERIINIQGILFMKWCGKWSKLGRAYKLKGEEIND
ncbi:MAG: hypothetical protein KH031_27020 [Clostridiales bacterium]|nr:hypothetical protein [Clostridiales bacterium]